MLRSQISTAALVVATAAPCCTPQEATPPSEPQHSAPPPEAKQPPDAPRLGEKVKQRVEAEPDDLKLGPLLGGARPAKTPEPGRYASAIEARQHRFVTREFTITREIRGGAMLEIADDGGVKGCAWAEVERRSSKSRYATRDGKPSRSQSEAERRFGMRGRWRKAAVGFAVEIDEVEYRGCDVDSESSEPAEPIEMTCFGLDAGNGLPVASIACRVDVTAPAIDTVALLLADTPRSGSWELREDVAGRAPDPTPAGAKPWLLLGADGGLSVEHDDRRRGNPLRVEFSTKTVNVPVGETPTRTP